MRNPMNTQAKKETETQENGKEDFLVNLGLSPKNEKNQFWGIILGE